MLYCEYCNYFKASGDTKGKNFCQYTGFIFNKKVEDYDLENHPCYEYNTNIDAEKVEEILKTAKAS